jgi:hypothetical protein
MSTYRFSFIKDGVVAFHAERDFDDDLGASVAAQKLSLDFEIEVWRGDELLARFRKITTH